MVFVLGLLVAITLAGMAFEYTSRKVRLPRAVGDWGAKGNDDPRIAAAGMLYCVATEDGPLDEGKSTQVILLLSAKLGLTPAEARACLAGGQRLARRLDGNLNSRLHQLRGSIERHCSAQEKQDVVDMLRAVAGSSIERVPSIREALGRIAASLLHG